MTKNFRNQKSGKEVTDLTDLRKLNLVVGKLRVNPFYMWSPQKCPRIDDTSFPWQYGMMGLKTG